MENRNDDDKRHNDMVQDTESLIRKSRQGKMNLTVIVIVTGLIILLLLIGLNPSGLH